MLLRELITTLSSTVSTVSSAKPYCKPTAAASSNPLVLGYESDRAAAKAGPKADQVLREVLLFLQSAMIAGKDHVLEMGRGATFLSSPPGILKQDMHTDFDFQTLKLGAGARRRKPLSIWIALQDDSAIFFGDRRYSYQAGDVVIFAGDCLHSGADNAASAPPLLLFPVLLLSHCAAGQRSTTGCSAMCQQLLFRCPGVVVRA